MKLLFITQKVDARDDVLGTYHRWIEEIANHFERVTVICLEEGEYDLPSNVEVFSLGKETGVSRVRYIVHFYKYVWGMRRKYDSVFVHMNQEYVLLAGLLWRMWGKKIGFWYNHTYCTLWTRLAGTLVHVVFHTSPFACTASFKNAIVMPAGIDTDLFKPADKKVGTGLSILSLGRISPLKHLEVLIDAVKILYEKNISFTLNIYGPIVDRGYFNRISRQAKPLENKVVFHGSIPNKDTHAIYNSHDVFVNLTPSGNFDKTVLEAMACEVPVLVSSNAFDVSDTLHFKESDSKDLADKLTEIKTFSDAKELRKYVVTNHGLSVLVSKLKTIYS